MADPDETLITALGGTAKINAWYDGRSGVNVSGTDVTTWDDYRGAVGFAPAMTGTSNPQYDAVNKLVSCNGTTSSLATVTDAAFDPSAGKTIIYIGSLVGSGYGLQLANSVGAPARWVTLYTDGSANIFLNCFGGGGNNITTSVPKSATKRMVMASITGTDRFGGLTPTDADVTMLVRDHFGARNQTMVPGADGGSTFTSGGWLLCMGTFAGSYHTANSCRALLIVDHALTGDEWAAVQTWATAVGHDTQSTIDATNSRLVIYDGNSITRGEGAVPGTSDYPTVVAAQTGLTSDLDWINAGVSSQRGSVQLLAFPTRVGPLLHSSHAKKVYVCWELHNDLFNSLTAAQATANVSAMCALAKAADPAVKTIAVTCIASGALTAGKRTEQLAANVLLRDSSWRAANNVDYLADCEAITGFTIGAQDASKYDADTIHPNATGYNLIATDATNGIAQAVTTALA